MPMPKKTISEKTREKLRSAQTGKVASDEARAKMSAARKGRRHSEETRAKIGVASKGRVVSEETRTKISSVQKGRVASEAARESNRKARLGVKLAEETRSKISKSSIGIPNNIFGKNAANADNCAAKYWELISPDKTYYRFKNLNDFIRKNKHLFKPNEVVVSKNFNSIAAKGLANLFYLRKDGRNNESWHGWTIGEKSKQDLLEKWEALHGSRP